VPCRKVGSRTRYLVVKNQQVKSFVVFYATRDGHTRSIAEYLAKGLRAHDRRVDVMDVAAPLPDLDLARYAAAILAAPIHIGKHEKAMAQFVRAHRAALERLPTTFLSVSLSQAGVDDMNRTAEQRSRSAAEVKKTIDLFLRATGWHPTHVHPVAGALLYRRYRPVIRLVMRIISRVAGGTTDTSRDHEYTDWNALSRFADEIVADIAKP
jgi:menaquinone-dependent protoporphyrinogen oxidase